MQRRILRSFFVFGFGLASLVASAAYADGCQSTPSLWQQIVVMLEGRIGLPPG
jgi:hypothetical protein